MPPAENVHVGAAGYVEKDGRVLLVQRGGHGPFAGNGYGTWALPGGWIEAGEHPTETARREVEEETGLQVRPLRVDDVTANASDDGLFHIVTVFVLCEYVSGEAQNTEPDKSLAVDWFDREMLVELDLFAPLDRWWRRPRRMRPPHPRDLDHESEDWR